MHTRSNCRNINLNATAPTATVLARSSLFVAQEARPASAATETDSKGSACPGKAGGTSQLQASVQRLQDLGSSCQKIRQRQKTRLAAHSISMDFDMNASAAQQELTMQDLAADAAQQTTGDNQHDQQQQQQQQPEAEEAHAEQQQQQQELTPLVEMGLEAMDSRRRDIHAKIDVLSQAGLAFLDHVKQQFAQSMDTFKNQVDTFCTDQVMANTQASEETIAAMARLSRAQQLVESLGLEARHRPQQSCKDDD